MSLIVQKFGGSSVRDAEHLHHVAGVIARTYKEGHDVIVVLSAQGNTTDDLIGRAQEVNAAASGREMDMLLSTGEQVSVALCAMALEKQGLPCVSLTAQQAGIHAAGVHQDAHISKVDPERVRRELSERHIVLVTGFQAMDDRGDVTTLGRGGSDTSAVALAEAFHAERCCIYTDVDGVYTADPRVVPNACKLEEISYDEMLELASHGAQVLHSRSVELAKRAHVALEVRSSLHPGPGTKVTDAPGNPCRGTVVGIAGDFIGPEKQQGRVTAVGTEILRSAASAAEMFAALQSAGIGLQGIHTTDRSISVLLEKTDVEEAVRAIHSAFFPVLS